MSKQKNGDGKQVQFKMTESMCEFITDRQNLLPQLKGKIS